MALTQKQIRQGYFEAIKQYTNNFQDIQQPKDAPLAIQIALDKLVEFGARDGSVQSESIGDLSLTFRDLSGAALPSDIASLLAPWCKVPF